MKNIVFTCNALSRRMLTYAATYILLLLFTVVVLLTSCRNDNTDYPAWLVQADSLLYAHPDSALNILRTCSDSINAAPQSVRMYYDLLLTQAKDKNYITHTSDSIVRQLVSYYENQGPDDKLARAYYIAGRVYDDLQNAPTALEYYQKAVDKAQEVRDYKLVGLTYSQMGTLYLNQDLIKESAENYRMSYEYALKGGDKLNICYSLQDLARSYTMLNKNDSALYFYDKVFALSSDEYKRANLVYELSSFYIQMKNYEKARKILSYDDKAYIAWADYYAAINKTDSARYFYAHSLTYEDNIYAKEIASQELYKYFQKAQDESMQLKYLSQWDICKDSISKKTKSAEVKRIEALYNYEKIKSERDKLEFEKSIQMYLIVLLILMLLFFITILIITYNKYRRKQQLQRNQEQRVYYIKEMANSITQKTIEDLPLCLMIRNNAQKTDFRLAENKWDELQSEMNLLHSNFVIRLRTLYPQIKEIEIMVCCFIKLGIRNTDIAHIISHSTNGVSNIRKRLYEKIHGKKGSAKQLDEFIKAF